MSAREWLVSGGEAVILQPWDRGGCRAEPVTIERVLKRDVVLSNGERFRVDSLQKQVGGTWGTTLYLVPPDDPRVEQTREAIRLSRVKSTAQTAYDSWWRGGRGVTARDVAEAFLALAELTEATQ